MAKTIDFLVLLALVATVSVSAANFNETCSADKDCDAKIALRCHKGRCDCARPEEMTYSGEKKSCIVKATYSCGKIEGMEASELLCDKHAACVDEPPKGKFCKCQTGYSNNDAEENQCQGDFTTPCNNREEPCNANALLQCETAKNETEGRCGCLKPQDNLFENGKCWALVDGDCNFEKYFRMDCLGNATCVNNSENEGAAPKGKCKCSKGFVVDKHRRCVSGAEKVGVGSVILVMVAFLVSKA